MPLHPKRKEDGPANRRLATETRKCQREVKDFMKVPPCSGMSPVASALVNRLQKNIAGAVECDLCLDESFERHDP